MSRTTKVWALIGLCALFCSGLGTPRAGAQIDNEWDVFLELDLAALQPQPPWLLKSVTENAPQVPEDPRYSQTAYVTPELDALQSAANKRFRLRLLDGSTVIIARERIERRQSGLVWYGRLEGDQASRVVLSMYGDALSGSIRSTNHATHEISMATGGYHWIRQNEPTFNAPEANFNLTPPPGSNLRPMGCADPPTEIDVMVLYTPGARNENLNPPRDEYPPFGTNAMLADIYRFIGETNQSFLDCDVTTSVRLVHMEEIQYPDASVDTCTISEDMRTDPEIIGLRDQYGADIVVLLVSPDASGNGCTWIASAAPDDLSSDDAYCVAMHAYSKSQMSMTHEIGHVLGGEHACKDYGMPATATGYDHGHWLIYPGTDDWAGTTIMSTAATGNRKAFWSYPGMFLPGTSIELGTTGDGCTADDHRTLNESAGYVARYRCSSPGRPDVWMKDTWSDTGEEPLVLAPGDVIWNSPYIWVRRHQDTERLHEHEHEDPVAGTKNWIYVKLHNGAAVDRSGNLEVYWADSATTTAWESGWHLIQSTPTTIPASSSAVVETTWDPVPPASDSICLLAVWDSSHELPMIESASIAANVQNSNNFIWKNLTIVELKLLIPVPIARFIIRNPPDPEQEDPRRVEIRITPPPGEVLKSIIQRGVVQVELDDALMNAWEQGGQEGFGYRFEHGAFRVTGLRGASIELLLPPTTEGTAEISFGRLNTTVQREYRLDVEQRCQGEVDGGVSFVIRCTGRL